MAIDLLRQTKEYFKVQGIPEVDALILLEHLLQCSRGEVQLKLLRMTDDELYELDRNLRRLVLRRQNGEPVQYITGTAPFRYLEYQVGPGVLIPRPETESLVALVLEEIKGMVRSNLSVIDLGSGSGAIAIALSTERKELEVTAVENSVGALPWLYKNVKTLGPRVRVVAEDVASACVGEEFDIVVANPPYIPKGRLLPVEVRKEPAEALFGGNSEGTEIPAQFIAAAVRLLKPQGLLLLEHDEFHGSAINGLLAENFNEIKVLNDLTGRERFTRARKR